MSACRRFFYLQGRLVVSTDPVGNGPSRILRHGPIALSCRTEGPQEISTSLYKTDVPRSVLGDQHLHTIAYSPYGHRPVCAQMQLGFNGERKDPIIANYLLGNGKRVYSPMLMRFLSPDDWSPFAQGGLNCYAYCQGDPVNKSDPTGRAPVWHPKISALFKDLKRTESFMNGLRLPENGDLRVKGFIMNSKGNAGTAFTLKLVGDNYAVKTHPEVGLPTDLTGYRHPESNTYFYVGKTGTPPRRSSPSAGSPASSTLPAVAPPSQITQSELATLSSAPESHRDLLNSGFQYANWTMFNDPDIYAYVGSIRQDAALGNV